MPQGKPNILVIWGDDIGISNLSCYSDGLMGYRTPNIDRTADEVPGSPTTTGSSPARRARGVHLRAEPARTGMTKVGLPGAEDRSPTRRPDDRHGPQSSRLCHRPVRQEPSGRPGRAPADRARVRRVLRQFVSPERRGGARARPARVGVMGVRGARVRHSGSLPSFPKTGQMLRAFRSQTKGSARLTGSWCRPPTCSDHLCLGARVTAASVPPGIRY